MKAAVELGGFPAPDTELCVFLENIRRGEIDCATVLGDCKLSLRQNSCCTNYSQYIMNFIPPPGLWGTIKYNVVRGNS